MSRRISLPVLGLVAALAACDRPAPTATTDEAAFTPAGTPARQRERAAIDRLTLRLARALADRDFRESLKAELDRSLFPEHKLPLQGFLNASDHQALKAVARLNAMSEAALEAEAKEAIPLEFYFPVPAHRASWSGAIDLLVASAREDRESPVAYDLSGRRRVLSADTPPSTPVLAVVPVETDFAHPHGMGKMECTTSCGGGGGTTGSTTPPPGLYLTYAHFVQDFEG
jgi:hypothetical protein